MSGAGDDDASLLAASQAGDVDAFGKLIERYHNLVCAIAYSRTGDRAVSEDIAQETFLAGWRGIAELREADKLRPWLCSIARHRASKALRGRRAADDISVHEGQLSGDPGPLAGMLAKEVETAVWAALEKLPETYREPLVLFYREDQSIKEVALGLGLTEETAKQRLSRGRQQLRDNIGELVEQTLQKGRPRKAAAAAILAVIIAQGGKPALASARTLERTGGRHARRKAIATAMGLGSVAALVAVIGTYSGSRSVRPSRDQDSTTLVTELRRAHDAWQATHPAQPCRLSGRVLSVAGAPIRGALVAIFEGGTQSTAIEPVFQETRDGSWSATVPVGTYAVSASAPGVVGRAVVVTCGSAQAPVIELRLRDHGARLHGVVGDTEGGPVSLATVVLMDPARPDRILATRSHADGSYELGAEPGLYTALVVHPEYTLEARPITLGDDGMREDVTLLPGGSVEGTVVDDKGAPLVGARVTTVAPTFSEMRSAPARWQMASIYGALRPSLTDADGRFVLRGLPPGHVQLAARSSAFVTTTPTSFDLTLAETKTGVVVATAAARAIRGFVAARDAGSTGVANVQVIAMRDGTAIALPAVATTDGGGQFEIDGLAPGTYRLAAVGGALAPYVGEPSIELVDRDATDQLILLDRGVVVRGTTDARAHVTLAPDASTMSATGYLRAALTRADVDEHGAFTLAGVMPGRYVIAATTFHARGELALEVGTAAPASLEIALAARPVIEGQVVDARGVALAGVLVQAHAAASPDPLALTHLTVRTDERGAFKIVGVSPGRYQLRVYDQRGQRAWAGEGKRPFRPRDVEVAARGAAPQTLAVADATATVRGTVVGADGKPVADTWIEARERGARRRPELFPAPPILTDAAGRFSIDGLSGTEFLVEAASPDGTLRATSIAHPNATLTLALRSLVTCTGTVTAEGTPVAAFEVHARDAQTESTRIVKATGGRFSLALAGGEHEIEITSARGYAKTTIKVGEAQSTTLDVALTAWGSIHGRVVGRDGQPWANAMVLVREEIEPTLERTDATGSFTIEHVVAGHNQLSILQSSDPGQLTTIAVDLKAGEQLDLGVVDGNVRVQTTASASADLGLQFFVSATPPTAAQRTAVATDPSVAAQGGNEPSAALWIAAVVPSSPAARAGLRAGDRVTGVGFSKVVPGKAAVEMMRSLSTSWRSRGRAVPWTVVRDGTELTIDVLVP
jgi:RNA polymerase sigma factor (sigma-70 family)